MKHIIELSCGPAICVIAILELALFIMMIKAYRKTKSKITLCSALITIGLFLDSALIGLGFFTFTPFIAFISRIRFISHGLLIPLLFPVCAYALEFKKPWKQIVLVITAILMGAGLAEACATVLGEVTVAGVTRCASVKGMTPVWAEKISRVLSFGTVIPLMAAGIVCWVKEKIPFLFLSGFLMFVFAAVGPATGNSEYIFYLSMYGEILMVWFAYKYAKKTGK